MSAHRQNPRRLGAMSWDEAIAMMRSDLRSFRFSDDESEDFDARVDKAVEHLMSAFRTSAEFRFPTVRAARLKRVWLDYGRTGVVRDERGLDSIAEQVLFNIALLHVTNLLSGHDSIDPAEFLEQYGFDDLSEDEKFMDFLTDPDSGAWYVSDFGLPYLMGAYALILRAETPEDRLLAVDKALNVVHQRSDLASWFVEGGTKTLQEVADQE